jgi:hypothetical protein
MNSIWLAWITLFSGILNLVLYDASIKVVESVTVDASYHATVVNKQIHHPKIIPNVWVQYGVPRTATTLQFHTLCTIMYMLHSDEPNDVGCHFVMGKMPYENIRTKTKYSLIKTHDPKLLLNHKQDWVFTTDAIIGDQNSDWREVAVKIQKQLGLSNPIKYVQNLKKLEYYGYKLLVNEINQVFSLSETETIQLMDYLRYWEILRRCCGVQQSSENIHRLRGLPSKESHQFGTMLYPACEIYDLDQVESSFLKTSIVQQYGSYSSTISTVSDMDPPLTGTYCSDYEKKIVNKTAFILDDHILEAMLHKNSTTK